MNTLGVASGLEMIYIYILIMIVSRKFIAGMPSILGPASGDRISASALLWDTAVCFSKADEIGTNVCDQKKKIKKKKKRHLMLILSLLNFKQNRWNNDSLESIARFPTWQYCL